MKLTYNIVLGNTEQVCKMNSPVLSRALLQEIWSILLARLVSNLSCYFMQLLCNSLYQLLGVRHSKEGGKQRVEKKKGGNVPGVHQSNEHSATLAV